MRAGDVAGLAGRPDHLPGPDALAGLVCAFYASGPAAALPREEHGGAQTAHKAD